MLELMDCDKTISDGETGHFKPRFDDMEVNLKYYEELYEIQKNAEDVLLFNGNLEESYFISNSPLEHNRLM